jgi:glycosyltransferase involved in cell wall biosynthesis
MLYILFWMFVGSAAVQFLFFTMVAIALAVYKKPEPKDYFAPGISVIISAKNECENLKKLIPVLLDQRYKNFEIILVDDNSGDETYDFAINLDKSENKFKLVRIDETPDHINNKKFALTLGIKAAKYDHVLLTDADCMPNSDMWIQEMSSGFTSEKKKFVISYSQYYKKKGLLNDFITFETLLTAVNYVGIGLLGNPYMAVGRNIAYRKSFFLENKGFGKFQGVLGGDDDLLINQHANRKNTSFVLSPESTVYSYPKTTLKDFIRQKTRHLSVGKHYSKTDKLLLGILSISKTVFWIAFFAVIMSVYQTYFVLAGFVIVMVSLLSTVYLFKKKTGDRSKIWMLPVLDFMFIFYYISTGLRVLFTKKVKWK